MKREWIKWLGFKKIGLMQGVWHRKNPLSKRLKGGKTQLV